MTVEASNKIVQERVTARLCFTCFDPSPALRCSRFVFLQCVKKRFCTLSSTSEMSTLESLVFAVSKCFQNVDHDVFVAGFVVLHEV